VADHVYRRFTRENLFTTTILAQNQVIVSSGSAGWTGNTNLNNNTLSLYGGIRSRSDVGVSGSASVHIYPLDQVDTQSIDGVIQIPGEYPQTGSINIFACVNLEQPNLFAVTDTLWWDNHYSVITRLSDWHSTHGKHTYPMEEDYPFFFTGFHIPEMFYGRTIATGSVMLTVNAFIGSPFSGTAGPVYWKDDAYGRLWEVPTSSTVWQSGTHVVGNVFYNEGLIVFTNPDTLWHARLLSGEGTEPHFTLQFNGAYPIKSMIALCRLNPAEVNASNNPTYYTTDETGKRWATNAQAFPEAVTYVTAIGLYNEERQLVGVAKIAQPIRKREQDDLDIKLRLDL
jgi:hypothetical protein